MTDGNIHVIPTESSMPHQESKDCWCEPELVQPIDDEHDKEVWAHRGYEEVNQ